MAASLVQHVAKIRVSSVLNRDVKQFGKQYLTDGNDDTCWNSDQGSPQWISVIFSKPVKIEKLQLQFQGGFVGKDCWIEASVNKDEKLQKIQDIFLEDTNMLQTFNLQQVVETSNMKIVFNTSTDLFGRVIVYKLEILGES
ncbi:nuclear receptor 2C2-associated protein-like [Limulus polyphemus]|uniref:Nuclear receptor 2C2-associated protein-like n=1 Tax=Limulus polyphemus TaxID=6850 RepID=A0ABM1C660_LIMPO|nr:nuclear receptor 2C2-associated protein-like [Limulus polyphemus]